MLGCRRIYTNGVVKILLGSTHLDRHSNTLHDLFNSTAYTMCTNHLKMSIITAVVFVCHEAHKFEKTLLLVLVIYWVIVHISELRLEHPDLIFPIFLYCVFILQPTGSNRWLRKYNHRYNISV